MNLQPPGSRSDDGSPSANPRGHGRPLIQTSNPLTHFRGKGEIMSGQLMVHAGGIRRTREELATIAAPPATDSWKPIPHFELVSHLIEGLRGQKVIVKREQY